MKDIKKICPVCGRKVFVILEDAELQIGNTKHNVYIITPHNNTENEFCKYSNRRLNEAS